MNKEPDSHRHESTQSELVHELRELVSSVRTADFHERISQGKPLTDLIQQIRAIREDLSTYQVDGERMQASLRPPRALLSARYRKGLRFRRFATSGVFPV